MHTREQQLDAVATVARALGTTAGDVVFVGGAVVGCYVDDPAAPEIRPTRDIDLVLEILAPHELEELRTKLQALGFRQVVDEKVTCRFRHKDLLVDVMSTRAIGWAPANPWFQTGFANRVTLQAAGESIQILPLPYFLAAKYAAFKDRGGRDPRMSHDLEDIVYILDNKPDIEKSLTNAPEDVSAFLSAAFYEMLHSDTIQEAIEGNLSSYSSSERLERINSILGKFANKF